MRIQSRLHGRTKSVRTNVGRPHFSILCFVRMIRLFPLKTTILILLPTYHRNLGPVIFLEKTPCMYIKSLPVYVGWGVADFLQGVFPPNYQWKHVCSGRYVYRRFLCKLPTFTNLFSTYLHSEPFPVGSAFPVKSERFSVQTLASRFNVTLRAFHQEKIS
jgi:hypothetical protein